MHYKNGRPAKIGDKVLVQPKYGLPYAGVLVRASEGSNTCNGDVVPLPANALCVTLSDCVHLDDVTALVDTQITAQKSQTDSAVTA